MNDTDWGPQSCPLAHVHSDECGANPGQLAISRLRTTKQIHREEPLRIRTRAWIAWWLRDRWTEEPPE